MYWIYLGVLYARGVYIQRDRTKLHFNGISYGGGAANASEKQGLSMLMKEAERKEDLLDRALESTGMEANGQAKNAGTQMLLHVVQSAPGSDCSCNSPSGSAVSALQSKFKEISQRRSKAKEAHDVPLKIPTEPLQTKSDKEQSSFSIPEVKIFKSSSSADEIQNLTVSNQLKENLWEMEDDSFHLVSRLGDGSRMENAITRGDGGTFLSKSTSSPRYWTPPKGFWKVAQRQNLVSNREVHFLPTTMKIAVHTSKEEQKLRPGVTVVQGLDSTFQKERSQPIREDILYGQRGHNMEMAQTERAQTTKTTTAMMAEGQYQPPLVNKGVPPSYKEADLDTAIIFGSEFNFRFDLTLSPRHEKAKRLLERARLKARSQNQNADHGGQTSPKDISESLSVRSPPPQIITTTHELKVPLPVQLQDVQRRNRDHGAYLQRQSQLFSHVHFDDKSKKQAEPCYPDKVYEPGRVLMDSPDQQSKASDQQSKAQLAFTILQGNTSHGLGQSHGSEGIPLAILTNQGDPSLEPKKCEACGSILTPSHPKESGQNVEGKRNLGNQWFLSGQSGRQNIQPNRLESTVLTGSSSLDESFEAAGPSDAVERVSAFGKLRRRSRKGENRVETSHGPYARCQDLLAQRRNSRTRSNLDEVAGPRSKPARGVTFATHPLIPTATSSRNYRDSAGIQLPIKSALKSGSKSRPTEQHGVKILPSAQEVERSPHHAVATPQDLGAPSRVPQVSSGLTPCIKPSSLRYISPAGTPVEPLDAHSQSEDPSCGTSRPPIVRATAMSKTEDLRAELLRSEYRKAELQWDENFGASRRTLEREGRPKLSLRRFFSAMGLNSMGKLVKGSRSSSMEHLSLSSARASPSPTHKGQTLLQRTPSLQALHTESPLAQLRKASSVQSLQSPKKKYERSNFLGELHLPLPLEPRDLHVIKGVETLDTSQVSGPTGRIIQTFPDGSLLLELTRSVNAHFGFVISRGKGRPDSGIYVEKVGGSTAENIYTSLLGVGDEILEVNGEKVIGLSLDQVTCLMTRESTATVRIIPHRWIQH